MRILVYGAGVQGSELTHRLLQNEKNVVTLLTRGEWKDAIDEKDAPRLKELLAEGDRIKREVEGR